MSFPMVLLSQNIVNLSPIDYGFVLFLTKVVFIVHFQNLNNFQLSAIQNVDHLVPLINKE